ncbi:MAG TPA: hypothetical protein VGE54_04475 [Brevundimonas sp.]
MSDRLKLLKAATRMAFFDTGFDGWDYATSGGTIFLVSLNGKPYGITATHVRQTFEWRQLCVTDEKDGRQIAGLKFVSRATNLTGDAEGTDIGDISIIEFSDDIGTEFFNGGIFSLDQVTTGGSETGDALIAYGLPKEHTTIGDGKINPTYAELGFEDSGAHDHDPFLRRLIGQWHKPVVTALTGMSGCGVFNTTKDVLTGVLLRGGVSDGVATGLFIDIEDVTRILNAIHTGTMTTNYRKIVRKPV